MMQDYSRDSKINSLKSKEINSFVKSVDKRDLRKVVQKMRVMKKFSE